jgi:hypothetical protein
MTRERLVGAMSFGASGVAFLVSIGCLIAVDGPASPNILTTLASPNGREIFDIAVATGVVGAILYLIAATTLYIQLRDKDDLAMLVVLAFAIASAAVLIGVLAFEYVPGAVAQEGAREGFSTTDPAFYQLVVSAHKFADVGGWASIAMLASTVLIVSVVLRGTSRWPALSLAGFAMTVLAITLFLLDSSYAYLVAFGLWEIAVAAGFVITPLNREQRP